MGQAKDEASAERWAPPSQSCRLRWPRVAGLTENGCASCRRRRVSSVTILHLSSDDSATPPIRHEGYL
jgi:hypothetical protein